jgi:5-methylcytosine-specific restriction protein A
MLLFKNSAKTMEGVLNNAKHATDGKPHHVKPGDIILIAQTKSTLLPRQKPIRWIMNFVSCEEDVDNLSDKIWGKHWRYLINGENVRPVEPFDLNEIKITSKNYDAVQTFAVIESEDEKEVLNWISESVNAYPCGTEIIPEEFKEGKTLDYDELIKKLDLKYRNTPEFQETIVELIQRPSLLSNAIKEKYGYKCMICGYPGFLKKDGEKYAEVHHMIELNKKAPETLQSWNLLVVCPLCHKKLHYADVTSEFLDPGWKIVINGEEHISK